MNDMNRTAELRECMEEVLTQLGVLHSVIDTLQMGLQSEHMGQQAVDSMVLVGYCVQNMKRMIDCRLQQLEEYDKQIEEISKA